MTTDQFRSALKKLDLTQAWAASLLGLSIRTVNGYANGEPIPEPVARLLRLMIRNNIKPEDVK